MSEKQYKPVPDVECLKYHGTPDKPDIKIFVSHRIDLDSETIDNPLYIPVRCGAVYDEREDVTMLGDDTGDNISEKRESFCELTVQYWAWKNVNADYYGLCHYRRYLGFSEEKYDVSAYGCIHKPFPTQKQIAEFGLNEETIRSEIDGADLILGEPVNVRRLHPQIKNLKDYCRLSTNDFNLKDIDLLLETIKEFQPEYYEKALRYYKSPYSRWYNCYIMKKSIFFDLCAWQFEILFALEKKLKTKNYSSQMKRELGFFAEHLFGIYFLDLIDSTNISFKEKQIVFFESVDKQCQLEPAFTLNNIPVVFMASDYYVPYLCTAIQSIADTATDNHNYDVIIFTKGIFDRNKDIIVKHFASYENISIRFYVPINETADYKFHIAATTYSEEAYYRVLTPWILLNYEKAIVLDCDLIAQIDLAKLYEIPLSDKEYCGAAIDYVYQGMLNGAVEDQLEYTRKEIGMKTPYSYINTGVMLLNLVALREHFSKEEILKYVSSKKFRIQEQDSLNALFEGRVHYIDTRWNYYIEVNEFIKKCIKYAPSDSEKSYRDVDKGAYILHYANNPKPWDAPLVRYGEVWWSLARRTPYYEEVLRRMMFKGLDNMGHAVYDLQCRHGIFDNRSGARKFADKLLPPGTRRREFAKLLLPKGSLRWRFCKQIYYIFRPKYRPKKEADIEDTVEEDED